MNRISRRNLFGVAASVAALSTVPGLAAKRLPFAPMAGPRCRAMLVNDLAGDIDGLFGAVHALLSPAAQVRGIVATAADMTGRSTMDIERDAASGGKVAQEMLNLMGLNQKIPVHIGAAKKMAAINQPAPSAGSDAIIAEAMRDDTALPLFVTVGGGLTEVASALIKEPRIGSRITIVWIGGDLPDQWTPGETNFNIDPLAAQYVFNNSQVRIWQVPRAVYKTCLISATELQAHVAPYGKIGQWLYRKVADFPARFGGKFNTGETWTLGDSPLVVLTALTDWVPSSYAGGKLEFERIGSSDFETMPTPTLKADGGFTANPQGRPMRMFRSIDTRMMFGDFFAKLRVNYG